MTIEDGIQRARAEGRILGETAVRVPAVDGGPSGMGKKRPNKYGNKKTLVDGIAFDSKKEANRYLELKAMEKCGVVRNLRLQVRIPIPVNSVKVATYIADFTFEELIDNDKWTEVVEDVKSAHTRKEPYYRLKSRLLKAALGIEIREV